MIYSITEAGHTIAGVLGCLAFPPFLQCDCQSPLFIDSKATNIVFTIHVLSGHYDKLEYLTTSSRSRVQMNYLK